MAEKVRSRKVRSQIDKVVTIMKLCENMEEFRAKFARVFKKTPLQVSFDEIGWTAEEAGQT
jgi:ribosomal protein L17